MKNIGKVLRICRLANNLTLMEASSISSVSHIYISELERQKKANVSDEILEKLAKAYDLKISQIIELETFYNNLLVPEERKFRCMLLWAVIFMENNVDKQ